MNLPPLACFLLLLLTLAELVSPAKSFAFLDPSRSSSNRPVGRGIRPPQFSGTTITTRKLIFRTGAAAPLKEDDSSAAGGGDGDDLSLEAFQKAKEQLQDYEEAEEEEDEFDGYAFRDIIYAKWGKCFDVDFNRVESFGFKKVYLNILPFHLGRRPFRHASEYDYLCHLQAVVEILREYNQLDYVLYQIGETNKRPLPGRSPLVAVPCRLDLTKEQVDAILGG